MSKLIDLIIEQNRTEQGLRLVFKGAISEKSTFPDLIVERFSRLNFDLGEVSLINSYGVRVWMKWMWKLEKEFANAEMVFERCAPVLIKHILIVKGFIPKNVRIKSIYLPYYCGACDQETKQVVDAHDARLKQSPSGNTLWNPRCPTCTRPMETEISPQNVQQVLSIGAA